jgi:hypothetical protein
MHHWAGLLHWREDEVSILHLLFTPKEFNVIDMSPGYFDHCRKSVAAFQEGKNHRDWVVLAQKLREEEAKRAKP